MRIYYAKPDQTYEEHLQAAYSAWVETVKAKHSLIERLAQKYQFSSERFLKGSLLTVLLHDIGKLIEPFQMMMEAKRKGDRFDYKKNYRHELASLPFIFAYWSELQKQEKLSPFPFEAFVVAGHHRSLDTDFSSFQREMSAEKPKIFNDGIVSALQVAQYYFKENDWLFPTVDINKCEKSAGINALKYLINSLPKMMKLEETDRTRILYALMKGILHYADWYGSAGIHVNYSVMKKSEDIINQIKERCRTKKLDFKGLTEFQHKVGSKCGHVIAVAPTGSGKTEASLLWAMKNSTDMGGAKVIYLLPTMATANSIWDRLCQIFGGDNVGLSHSSADLILNTEHDEDLETVIDRRNLSFDHSFIRPVTVATVDQLLTIGFNAGKWALKEINAANAVIILDEIHAYDGWTLGLIVSSIKHFAALGARFLLMSATMPENLIELFKNVLPDAKVIKDTVLLHSKRSQYFVRNKYIEEDTDEIRQAVRAGYKVLVVVNTVEKCQYLAKQFIDLKPVCYHSRFILKDRQDIERRVEFANLVIATQIVEVSLDIDFDWLFTECAPPDALAQRAGRVNRYRDLNRDSRIYIYKADDKSEKLYNPLNDEELLKRSFEEFANAASMEMTEEKLLEIIEKVYRNYPYENREGFKDALDQYRISQKNRLVILDNRKTEDDLEQTRMSKYETVSVIPYCFYDRIKKITPNERRFYELKVPYWYLKNNSSKSEGIVFCNLTYDPNLGAILKPDNSPYVL